MPRPRRIPPACIPTAFLLLAAALPLLRVAAADPTARAPVQAVFLLVVDTLRSDRLSCYGYGGHQTPHIDALAGRGLRFSNAHTVASWTTPSVGALLTSRYPRQLGLVERPTPPGREYRWRERRSQTLMGLPAHARTLAERMSERGFRTAAFVDQPALNAAGSFARGFSEYFYPGAGGEIRRRDPAGGEEVFQSWSSSREGGAADAALVEVFSSWLERQAPGRLFGWVHLLAPHVPYAPPAPFAPPPRPDGEPASDSDRYDGEVRYADALVGRLLGAIESRFAARNVVVVLLADHGEEFGEHGHHGHGHSLHGEVSRIPLIVAAPGRLAPARVDVPVTLLDVVPTLLALADPGEPMPAGLEGRSLVSAGARARPVFAEGKLYGPTEASLIGEGYKLIDGDVEARLYDLRSDPGERRDLAGQQPARVEAMRLRLEARRSRYQAQFLAARLPPAQQAPAPEREEGMWEALQSLGYVSGDEGP